MGHDRVIEVAAGCLVNAQGEVLIAQRPAGKVAAGQWEFPGGKLEPGETPRDALVRELQEELGVTAIDMRPLIRVTHAYSDRTVRLDCWKITRWQHAPHGREDQAFAWVRPEATAAYPILAADAPILRALQLPEHYVFTPERFDAGELGAQLPSLPRGALLRLRCPGLDADAYAHLAQRLLPEAHRAGLRVVLDGDPQRAIAIGADGWHARASELSLLRARPPLSLCLASCHSLAELQRAAQLGFDAAVLGAVQATASHPGRSALGWAQATAWLQAANLPVYLIGGLSPEQLGAAHAHYAQGIAGIRAYWRGTSAE